MRVLLATVVLSGCFRVSHRSECQILTTPVADDEITDQGSAEGVLSQLGGSHTHDGTLADGTPVTVIVSVARGRGDAEHVHGRLVDASSRSFGVGSFTPAIGVPCDDSLRVPLEVQVVTDDASYDAGIAAIATSWGDGLDEIDVFGRVPLARSGLAEPADLAAEDQDTAMAFVSATYQPSGASTGFAGWEAQPGIGDDSFDVSAQVVVSWP